MKMKFSIYVNQFGVFNAGLVDKTDLVDWALLDYVADWQLKNKSVKLDEHVWINYRTLMDQMPLLKLNSKGAVSNRIAKLKDLGLITTVTDQDLRIYLKVTELYLDSVKFISEKDLVKDPNEGSSELPGVHSDERGVHDGERGVHHGEHSLNYKMKQQELNTKEKNTKKESQPKPVDKSVNQLCSDFGITGQLMTDFIAHRKAKKAVISLTALEGFKREAGLAGISIHDAVKVSIENNWQGFKAAWFTKNNTGARYGAHSKDRKQFYRDQFNDSLDAIMRQEFGPPMGGGVVYEVPGDMGAEVGEPVWF
jgi:hypothetical protein